MRDEPRSSGVGPDASSLLARPPGEVADPELRDLQLAELSILREFVRVCEAHGLRYYLAYGSLLGAVRHHGFIPWDNDIDVTMPRDDYNRFAEICASHLRPGFGWQSYSTERDYPHLFGKLIDTGTVMRQAPTQHLPFRQSVCIDVFPLDGLADGPIEELMQRVLIRICRLRLGADVNRVPAKRFLVQLVRILPRDAAIAAIETMNRHFPVGRARRWVCVGGPYGHRRQTFPSWWFGPGATQAFEGLTAVGPVDFDRYLAQLYGDYMTPPPHHRASHHETLELRLEPEREADLAPR